jgi:hypothetical protein
MEEGEILGILTRKPNSARLIGLGMCGIVDGSIMFYPIV